jgi:hypothetical protein
MGKIGVLFVLGYLGLQADVQRDCFACHQASQIPSALIHKRYLMKYSTNQAMQEAIVAYLQNPKKEYSIMPSIFFLKFPMKEKKDFKIESVQEYLEYFDIKKKLVNSR